MSRQEINSSITNSRFARLLAQADQIREQSQIEQNSFRFQNLQSVQYYARTAPRLPEITDEFSLINPRD